MAHKENVLFFKTVMFDVTGTEINMSVSDTQATELGEIWLQIRIFVVVVVQLLCVKNAPVSVLSMYPKDPPVLKITVLRSLLGKKKCLVFPLKTQLCPFLVCMLFPG